MNAGLAWDTLRKTIGQIESGQGDWELNVTTLQTAIILLLEFPVEEIVEQVEQSDLPDRAVVTWLVFEARKLRGLDKAKVEALKEYWENKSGQKLLPMPQASAGGMKIV